MPPAPTDLTFSFGRGGGFTGLWQGHTIYGDGSVTEWSGRSAPDAEQRPSGRLERPALDALWAAIESIALFDRSVDERANITAWIRASAGERTVELWWPAVVAPNPAVTALDSLYEKASALVSQIQNPDH